uniref:RNase H type-1 domain-containing protein n=1 Tax=Trichogramma kaykai TaxID=54128 RepID=A0ABD2W9Z7_9HYME
MHGFCDASQKAYAAAVYAVVYDAADNPIGCHLLIAKTKVSPIKVLNIPRLELQGAVLLARLVNFVNTSLQQAPSLTYCWTDSNIVLAWLRSHPSRWKTFTANRVSEIHTLMPNVAWRHVPSKENPSDCASRGISAKLLIDHALWWHGPT